MIIVAVLFIMCPTTINAGLTNTKITLFAVVREANPGAGDWTKYGEQDNLPRLTETNDPVGGAWSWEITEQPSGFTGNPSISVNPLGGGNKSAEFWRYDPATGIAEEPRTQPESRLRQTVLAGQIVLGAGESGSLLDITGRDVAALGEGVNPVRHLAPGVYYLRSSVGAPHRRVVITQ